MGTLRDLQFALQLKIEELRQRDALIDELELELDAKDDLIRRLQGELDRMRITHGTPSSTSGQHHVSSLKSNRRTVITEPVNVDPKAILQNPPMSHTKSQELQRVIEEALSQNDWLKYLRRDLSLLVDCAYPTMVAQGVRITQEADKASRAFVIEEGKLEVSLNGQMLHTIDAGALFGELALLHNHACTLTVTAMTSCKLWVIDRQAFQRTMQRSSLLRINQSLDLLHSVPLLSVLPEDILIKISDVLQEYHYSDGDYILKHGSPGDTVFIIIRGQVKVLDRRLVSEDSVSVSVLFQGDSFGEKALKGEAASYLSAVAVGDVTCLLVDRQTVRRFIEPFEDAKKNWTNDTKTESEAEDDVLGDVSFNDVQVLCDVGKGRFGHTQLVHVRNDGRQVFVLKVIQKHTLLSTGHRERILSEKQILMDACCPFIVRLFRTFRDVKCLYMLMEACLGGDLWTLLRERGSFDEKEVHFYTACVLEALSFLHDRGVVHRDLKPENVLLDLRGYAKLTGFGSAKQLGSLQRSWSFCGSAGYQAPEIILHKGHGVMADYWALGVFIYELLDGSPPFIDPDQTKTLSAILKGTEACEFPNTISSLAVDLIKQLCRENPTDRLGQRNGVKDIREHQWFEGFDWDGLSNSSLAAPILPNVRMGYTMLACSQNEDDTDLSTVNDSDWDKDF